MPVTKVTIASSRSRSYIPMKDGEKKVYGEKSLLDGFKSMDDEAKLLMKASQICMWFHQFPNCNPIQAISAFFGEQPYTVKEYTKKRRIYHIQGIYITQED